MSSFLQNMADKAQSALNATPIGSHIPNLATALGGHGADAASGSTTGQEQTHAAQQNPATKSAQAQSGRSFALENMSHQLRVLQQQYTGNSSTIQKLITTQKGVAIDLEGLSRDTKAQSKELFMFGQGEADDLKDVTDRLAYLNFVHGSLAATLSTKLNGSRPALKSIRDAEATLTPRRNIRAGIMLQINRIKQEGQKGTAVDHKLVELQEQLRKVEADDRDLERQFEITKRKFIRENEEAKWAAIREYGEKLVLLSQASTAFVNELPSIPPSAVSPYAGASKTAGTKAALQRALDNWVTGHINVPNLSSDTDTTGFDTRSFGESHASELSSISGNDTGSIPSSGLLKAQSSSAIPHVQPSVQHSIDPSTLNQTPTKIPSQNITSPGQALANVSSSSEVASTASLREATSPGYSSTAISPTIAETGVPIAAGLDGPGPKTGSLSSRPSSSAPQKYETAEDEKKRLEREERDRVLRIGAPPTSYHAPPPANTSAVRPQFESAEDEKKRIEREERERVLTMGGSQFPPAGSSGLPQGPQSEDGGANVPPPYHD